MRIPRPVSLGLAVSLTVALLLPTPAAHGGTETIQDNSNYDVLHRDIDIKSLTVTYKAKGSKAVLRFKDLRKKKRLRLFVQFFNKPNEEPYSPTYGNFLELRINEKRKIKRINWVFGPDDAYEGYHREKCRGIKIEPDFKKDKITYKLPNKCARYLKNRGHIISYASTRKFTSAHWDDGSPADTTGDWFDTTYDLRVER